MKAILSLLVCLVCLVAASSRIDAATPPPAGRSLPRIRGVEALAAVNGEPVSWTSFIEALAAVHAGAEAGMKPPKQDPQALLDRLITGKLVAQEARTIGLDESQEYKAAVAKFRQDTLTKLILERPAAAVTRSDPADVDRIYRTAAGLAKFDAVHFERKPDADAFAASLAPGKDFAATARAAVAAGKAQSFDEGGGAKLSELQAELVNSFLNLKPGRWTGVVPLKTGWTVVQLLELSVPGNPEARAKAEEDALAWKRLQAVKTYTTNLRKRDVKIDRALLESLDFEAKTPGLAALKKDARVVATVQGGKPVTVADLAAELERAFFHGTQKAVQEKKINPKKDTALDELLVARLTLAEGTRLGLDKTPSFVDAEAGFEEGLLFTAFLKKVVLPDVKVSEADVRSWYDGHPGDYSSPGMLRLDSIAFVSRADAEDAWKKARDGADFGWLKKNAPGQFPAASDALRLNGGVFMTAQLDPQLAKTLSNPRNGDARLYAAPGGPVYAVLIREVIPSRTESYEAVRDTVGQTVVDERTKQLLDEWSAKLRRAYEVRTFVTPAELAALVQREFARKA